MSHHSTGPTSATVAQTLFRVALGGVLVAHGSQKLFGWFGGGGIEGTSKGMHAMGFRPGRPNAVLAGMGEAGAGVASRWDWPRPRPVPWRRPRWELRSMSTLPTAFSRRTAGWNIRQCWVSRRHRSRLEGPVADPSTRSPTTFSTNDGCGWPLSRRFPPLSVYRSTVEATPSLRTRRRRYPQLLRIPIQPTRARST